MKTMTNRKPTLKTRQAKCLHTKTIEISTAKVCTECEKVLSLDEVA